MKKHSEKKYNIKKLKLYGNLFGTLAGILFVIFSNIFIWFLLESQVLNLKIKIILSMITFLLGLILFICVWSRFYIKIFRYQAISELDRIAEYKNEHAVFICDKLSIIIPFPIIIIFIVIIWFCINLSIFLKILFTILSIIPIIFLSLVISYLISFILDNYDYSKRRCPKCASRDVTLKSNIGYSDNHIGGGRVIRTAISDQYYRLCNSCGLKSFDRH